MLIKCVAQYKTAFWPWQQYPQHGLQQQSKLLSRKQSQRLAVWDLTTNSEFPIKRDLNQHLLNCSWTSKASQCEWYFFLETWGMNQWVDCRWYFVNSFLCSKHTLVYPVNGIWAIIQFDEKTRLGMTRSFQRKNSNSYQSLLSQPFTAFTGQTIGTCLAWHCRILTEVYAILPYMTKKNISIFLDLCTTK